MFLFNGISAIVGYVNANVILAEEEEWHYQTHS